MCGFCLISRLMASKFSARLDGETTTEIRSHRFPALESEKLRFFEFFEWLHATLRQSTEALDVKNLHSEPTFSTSVVPFHFLVSLLP
jgi:hypothetical protein